MSFTITVPVGPDGKGSSKPLMIEVGAYCSTRIVPVKTPDGNEGFVIEVYGVASGISDIPVDVDVTQVPE